MAIFQIVLSVLALLCAGLSLFFALRAERIVKQAQARAAEPKPRKVVVPGKGIFSKPLAKKKPRYHSDEDIWLKEQDEKI